MCRQHPHLPFFPTQPAFVPGHWGCTHQPQRLSSEAPRVLKVGLGLTEQGTLGSVMSKLVNRHWRHVPKAEAQATQVPGLWGQCTGTEKDWGLVLESRQTTDSSATCLL